MNEIVPGSHPTVRAVAALKDCVGRSQGQLFEVFKHGCVIVQIAIEGPHSKVTTDTIINYYKLCLAQ